MTQHDFGTIDPATKSGSALAGNLNDFRDAVNSMHSGSARPSYVVAGMMWLDTSGSTWFAKLYDGTDDIVIARVDPTNNVSLQPPKRQEVVKTADYTIVANDAYSTIVMNKASAGTVNLPALSGAKFETYSVKNIAADPVTIDPNGAETIEGASTLVLYQGDTVRIWPADSNASWRIELVRSKNTSVWSYKAIGEIVFVSTNLTGVDIPPSSLTGSSIWIELTSGLTGVGNFNNGKLRTETVSGSGPLISAFATVDVASSPMYNTVVRLLNTEGRIIRPSASPGTIQDDAMQGHRHGIISPDTAFIVASPGGGGGSGASGGWTNRTTTGDLVTDGVNGTPRTAAETRMKNIGLKAYMRIL